MSSGYGARTDPGLKRLALTVTACVVVLLALAAVTVSFLSRWEEQAGPPVTTSAPSGREKEPESEAPPPSEPAVRLDSPEAIERAVAEAKPGDDLVVAGGTYRMSLDINRVSGTADKPIRIRAEPGSTVSIVTDDGTYALFLRNAAYWEIGSDDGRLEFDGDQTALATVGIGVYSGTAAETSNDEAGPAENITLRNVGIRRSGQELLRIGHGSRDIDVIDSDLTGSGFRRSEYGEGVYLGSSTADDDVRWIRLDDVRISGLTAEAIDIKPGVDHVHLSDIHISDIVLSSRDVLNKCAIAHRSSGQLTINDSVVEDVRRDSDVSAESNEPCGIYTVGPVRIERTLIQETTREALWVNNEEPGIEVVIIDSEFRANGGNPDGINHSGAEAAWVITGSEVGTVSSSVPNPASPDAATASSSGSSAGQDRKG